jgi:hypothetical protein
MNLPLAHELDSSQGYDEAHAVLSKAFAAAITTNQFGDIRESCLEIVNRSKIPHSITLASAYASRALLHNPGNWDYNSEKIEYSPRCQLLDLISSDLSLSNSINCRDNYYHEITSGIFYYIQNKPHEAFRFFSSAAKHHDFYRVVKDDYGGGAAFAKCYPTAINLLGEQQTLAGPIETFCDTTSNASLVFSIHMDSLYSLAFATGWIEQLAQIAHSGASLHFHVIYLSKIDQVFLHSLTAKAAELNVCICITTESNCALHRAYYASSRFIRGEEIMRRFNAPIIFCDADAHLKDPLQFASESLCQLLQESRILGCISRGPFNGYLPWRCFSATWLFCNNSTNSINFLRLISRAINYFWDERPRNWWIDQMGLEVAYKICTQSLSSRYLFADFNQVHSDLFATSEKYKMAKISRVPQIARRLKDGLGYWQAVREFQEILSAESAT